MELTEDVLVLITSYAPLEFLTASRWLNTAARDHIEETKLVCVGQKAMSVMLAGIVFTRDTEIIRYEIESGRSKLSWFYSSCVGAWMVMRSGRNVPTDNWTTQYMLTLENLQGDHSSGCRDRRLLGLIQSVTDI